MGRHGLIAFLGALALLVSTPSLARLPGEGGGINICTDFPPIAAGGVDVSCTALKLPSGTSSVSADCDAAAEFGRIWCDTDNTTTAPCFFCLGASGWWQMGDILGAGRSGGQTVTGSTVTNQHLTLDATSADTTGEINLDSLVDLFPSMVDPGPGTTYGMVHNPAFTFTNGSGVWVGIRLAPTFSISTDVLPTLTWFSTGGTITRSNDGTPQDTIYAHPSFSSGVLYTSASSNAPSLPDTLLDTNTIRQSANTGSTAYHPVTVTSQPIIEASGASASLTFSGDNGGIVGMWHKAKVRATAASASVTVSGTEGGLHSFMSRPFVIASNASATVTIPDRKAVAVYDIQTSDPSTSETTTGSVVVSRNTGLDCDEMTVGTEIACLRSEIAAASGRYALRSTGTAVSTLLGGVAIGSSTAPTEELEVTGDALVTGTVYGGNAASDTLVLESTSDTAKATVDIRDRLLLYTNVPSAPDDQHAVEFTGTLTTSGITQSFTGYSFNPTINSTNGVYIPVAFEAAGTWSPTAGNSNVYTGLYVNAQLASATTSVQVPGALLMNNSLDATASSGGSNGTTATYAAVNDTPSLTATGASTAWTVTNLNTITSSATLTSATGGGTPSALTVATRRGLLFNETSTTATGTLTLTTQVALDIAALTAAGTNLSIRSAGESAELRHRGDAIFGSGGVTTAPSAKLHAWEATLGDRVLRLQSTATNDDPTFDVVQGRTTTSGAVNGTIATIATVTGQIYLVEARILGICTAGSACTAGNAVGCVKGALYMNIGGTLTEVEEQDAYAAEFDAAADVDATCDFVVSGTNILVRGLGVANEDVTWHGTVTVQNMGS